MSKIHNLILTEYTEQLNALLDGFLGDVARFGVVASKYPKSNSRYNAGGQMKLSARALYRHVVSHRDFGFPILGQLTVASEEVKRLIDMALAFGEAYHRADALYEAGEGDMPQRLTPRFQDADMAAGEALEQLERAAVEAFVAEMEV